MPRAADPTPEQPLTRTVLMDARLLKVTDVGHAEIRELRILPGHAAGPHVHNGPVVGSILEGSAIYQIEGQPNRYCGPVTCSSNPRASASPGSTPPTRASRSSATSCSPPARTPR